MECSAARERLHILVDHEPMPVRERLGVLQHSLRCSGCRTAWTSLRRQRNLARSLPALPAPAHIRASLLAAVPAPSLPAGIAALSRSGRMLRLATAGAVLAGAIGVLVNASRGRAADVATALAGVNTWHLSGWREEDGVRVPWEVWGRKEPFLYREQQGPQLMMDDGQARLEILPVGDHQIAVRTRSSRNTDDLRWTRLTVGTDWEGAKPYRTDGDTVIYQWTDAGMQGPGSVAHDYFFVDRRTWLPYRWEYRYEKGGEKTVEQLDVEYDVAVPAGLDRAAPPAGAELIDALATPAAPLPTRNTAGAAGVLGELTPFKVDAQGNVLVRLRAWLGTTQLGLKDGSLFYFASEPIWARTINGQKHPWAITDDRGRPYAVVGGIQTGSGTDVSRDGTLVMWLTPMEPFAPGAPHARSLTVNLTLMPSVMLKTGSHNLDHQDCRWNVPLPAARAEILPRDYLASPAERTVRYIEAIPVAANVASSRSRQYECQSDYDNAIRWAVKAVEACRPDSNQAQFLRIEVAVLQRRVHRMTASDALLHEVIRNAERYPKTWDYYAHDARELLKWRPRRR